MMDYADDILPFADAAAFVRDTLANADEKMLKWLHVKPETRDIFCSYNLQVIGKTDKEMRTKRGMPSAGGFHASDFVAHDVLKILYNEDVTKNRPLSENIETAAYEMRHALDFIEMNENAKKSKKSPTGVFEKMGAAFKLLGKLPKLQPLFYNLELRANDFQARFNPELQTTLLRNFGETKKASFVENMVDIHVFGYPGNNKRVEIMTDVYRESDDGTPHPLYGKSFNKAFDNWKNASAVKKPKP